MTVGRFMDNLDHNNATTNLHNMDSQGNGIVNQVLITDQQHDLDPVVTSAELRLERLHLDDALSARDALVQHLAEACVSIRQKTTAIKRLEKEKADLEMQLSFMNGRQGAGGVPPGSRVDRTARDREYAKVQVEVGYLAEMFRRLEQENKQMKAQKNGEQSDVAQQMQIAPVRPSGWLVSLHKILRLVMPAADDEANHSESAGQPAPTATSASVGSSVPPTSYDVVDDDGTSSGRKEGNLQPATPMNIPPDERSRARNVILDALPVTPDTLSDTLKPIVIPSQFTFQDFVTTLPVTLRQQMGSYRLLQESTTSWSGEREEHGYFLTPLFKCATNPRATTVHRWSAADLGTQLNTTTECFYSKNGYWYYTGLYKTFWLDELSPAEWVNLPNETTQAIVKQTLAARKNTAPQNVYETGQLYAAGALRVACIGLQCVGFSHAVYTQLIEAAERCAQTGRWRNNQAVTGSGLATGPGSIWTPPSPKLSPHAPSTVSLAPHPVTLLSPGVRALSPHASSPSAQISILSSKTVPSAGLGDAVESPGLAGEEASSK
ncbi:hypothetical protein DAEQUDRAFT_754054 [Daedalea quercina L-15889]|uniref:DUF6697 domain-containing protein n=1 Tax=Daedalea quercina L-15889 TaxID=1314783 RepID=A0A165TWX1_9APHY|nr:hypothetical protein DAEQUDRAFT_754054 [Daedalea quercina L-15889]